MNENKLENIIARDLVVKTNSKPILKAIETNIVLHCNLNCKGCNHFSPLYSQGEGMIDFDKWVKAVNRLSELFEVKKFTIIGGEPLLHPRWLDFLRYLRKVFPQAIIKIRTNGILNRLLIENKKELEDLKIILEASYYGIGEKFKEKIDTAIKSKDSEIEFAKVFDRTKTKFEHPSIDSTGSQDKNESFILCRNKRCLTLTEDSIYCCNYGLSFNKLNDYFNLNMDIKQDNKINIFESNVDEIIEWLSNPKDCCKFCNLENRHYTEDWGLSKREKSEWIIS